MSRLFRRRPATWMVVAALLLIGIAMTPLHMFAQDVKSNASIEQIAGKSNPAQLTLRELRRRWKTFEDLPSEEQQQIRELHAAVTAQDDHSTELRQTLDKYARWLDTLTPSEHARVVEAETNDQRILVIKEIVEAQHTRLAEDLAPMEQQRRAPDGRRPSSFGGNVRNEAFERYQQKYQQIREGATDAERKRLDSMSRVSRFSFILALSIKYSIPLSSSPERVPNDVLRFFYGVVDSPEKMFGAPTYAEGNAESREKLGSFIVDLMMLPDIDGPTRYGVLDSQPKEIQESLQDLNGMLRLSKVDSLLLGVLYYKSHMDEVPADLRPTVAAVRTGNSLLEYLRQWERTPEEERFGRPERRRPPTNRPSTG